MINMQAVPKAWLVYLVDRRFDIEPELRNKIFVLFVYALIETNEDTGARLHALTVEAHRLKSLSCLHYLEKIRFMLDAAADLASNFSCDDMVFIGELRQQWLHGRIDSHFRESRRVRFVKNGKVVTRNVHHSAYWRIFREREGVGGLDHAIEPLRQRFTDAKTLYWSVYFILDLHMEKIRLQLHEHSSFAGPIINLIISPKGYGDTKAQAEAAGGCLTLRQVRAQVKSAPIAQLRRDPIFF